MENSRLDDAIFDLMREVLPENLHYSMEVHKRFEEFAAAIKEQVLKIVCEEAIYTGLGAGLSMRIHEGRLNPRGS